MVWFTYAGESPLPPAGSLSILFDNDRVDELGRLERFPDPLDLPESVCDGVAGVEEPSVPLAEQLGRFDRWQLVEERI